MLRPDTIGLTTLLGLLTAFGPVATDMYIPSMPEISRLLDASTSEVQLTLSSYLVGIAIGQVIYGPISDQYGRKPVLLLALVLFCGASALCSAAPNIETLIIARTLQAIGGSGAIVLPRAIVRDLYEGDRAGRELSRIGAVMSVAPVVAPLVGGIAAFVRLARQLSRHPLRRIACNNHHMALHAGDTASSRFGPRVGHQHPTQLSRACEKSSVACSPRHHSLQLCRAVCLDFWLSLRASGPLWPFGFWVRRGFRPRLHRLSYRGRYRDITRNTHWT